MVETYLEEIIERNDVEPYMIDVVNDNVKLLLTSAHNHQGNVLFIQFLGFGKKTEEDTHPLVTLREIMNSSDKKYELKVDNLNPTQITTL